MKPSTEIDVIKMIFLIAIPEKRMPETDHSWSAGRLCLLNNPGLLRRSQGVIGHRIIDRF
jgi:hypothetical protein